MDIGHEGCSNDANVKRKENQDSHRVELEAALYHDVPTNMTSSSVNTLDSAVSTATSPSSTTAKLSAFSLQLISTYIIHVWHAIKACFQIFPSGYFFSSVSGLESPPSTNKGQRRHETESSTEQKKVDRLGITIVVVSDTHGEHEKLTMPEKADMLISAGDWTLYGKKDHLISFNEWLGKLPYQTKIVVNGNHECNAMWKRSAKTLLSNATLLVDEFVEIDLGTFCNEDEHKENYNEIVCDVQTDIGDNLKSAKIKKTKKLKIYGTNFYWPCSQKSNPYFDQIDSSCDIVISHCPALGHVDNNRGCPALLNTIQNHVRPRVVISGHEHTAREIHFDQKSGVTFVNAANAKGGIKLGHACGKQPIILTL